MDGVRGPQGGRGSLPPPRPPPAPRELLPRVRRRPPGASLRQESHPRRPGASAHGHAAPPGRYSLRLRVRHCQLLPSRFQKKRLARPGERAGGVLGSRPFPIPRTPEENPNTLRRISTWAFWVELQLSISFFKRQRFNEVR